MQLKKLSGLSGPLIDPARFSSARSPACQADAILDSLQMPCLSTVPASVIVNPSISSSDGASDKGELDSDDSIGEPSEKLSMGNATSLKGRKSISA
jgi:hypothetical protein